MQFPYDNGSEEEELREAIESGRRHKIAAEVWNEFLESRRIEILKAFENAPIPDDVTRDLLAELRVMKKFRDICTKMIGLGEIAEERMNEIGR